MALTAGIVGLPNVGKSTLFNAITKSQIDVANYPFATIDPNIGVVEVPDEKLTKLFELMNSENRVPTTFIFTDIAGLVKGASKGEGLGNKFLESIKNTNAICHVVRCFENPEITHVEHSINPIRDIEIINLELIFKDSEIIENFVSKIRKKSATTNNDELKAQVNLYEKMLTHLETGKMLRSLTLSKKELSTIKTLNLITLKPVIYVANIHENNINNEDIDPYYDKVKKYAKENNSQSIAISAKIEFEISLLSNEDKKMFMADLEIQESGLDKLIKSSYSLLNLETFFTAGKQEVRAWTFKKGTNAQQCAGIIHTDFEKGFIRAEVMKYNDLILFGSKQSVKDAGKWTSEGKDYIMQNDDVVLFRFNI